MVLLRPSPSRTPPLLLEAKPMLPLLHGLCLGRPGAPRGGYVLGIRDAAQPFQEMQGTPGQGGDPQVGREQTGQKVMLGPPCILERLILKTLMEG